MPDFTTCKVTCRFSISVPVGTRRREDGSVNTSLLCDRFKRAFDIALLELQRNGDTGSYGVGEISVSMREEQPHV